MRWLMFPIFAIMILVMLHLMEPGGGGVRIINLGVGEELETINAEVYND